MHIVRVGGCAHGMYIVSTYTHVAGVIAQSVHVAEPFCEVIAKLE